MDEATTGLTAAQVRRQVLGEAVAAKTETEQDPVLAPYYRMSIEHAYGGVWARPGLGLKERSLVSVSVLVSLGRAVRLGRHLQGALNTGWTPDELREACMHLTVYAGFPAAGDALQVLSDVLKEAGLTIAVAEDLESGATGAEMRRQVLGPALAERTRGDVDPFMVPVWGHVVEHGWGAVWTRPGLTPKERSLITISALAALGRSDHLRLHLRGGLNNGWTAEELREACLHVSAYAGMPAALAALKVLSEVARDPA